jgi:ring-1,2-phenylacetyl-CoA epoxidase subunit PaaE
MDRLKWKVIDIARETHEAYSFMLENKHGILVNYEAGQFLTFIFKHKSEEIRRSYSISSAPGIDAHISITVKRKPNGEISRHLINHVHTGDELISIYPAGRFIIETNVAAARHFFFIAAGSGIVPVFSLIKKILKEEPFSKIILIFQNHSEENIIFKDQFSKFEKDHPDRFKWKSLLSQPRSKKYHPQKLNNFLLEKLVYENVETGIETAFYLCGPPSLTRMAQFTLKWMGYGDEQIKKENFTVDFIPPPPIVNDLSIKKIILHYHQKTYHIETAFPVNILQAALDKNIRLPYSCRSGRCSSCVARCVKGKVIMSNNEVLTDKDLQNGLVLTCVGYAETDLELEW